MIPKIIFKISKVEETLPVIEEFLSEKSPWKEAILGVYSDLKEKLDNSDNKKIAITDFFIKKEKEYAPFLEKIKQDFQNSWDKINDKIMIVLEEIHEIKWPSKFNEFTARVTLNPICPRYLEYNTFDVYFGFADMTMKSIVLHEISHFIFFEKFKEIYPDTNPDEFESPHLIWKLSEIIPLIILNDKKIQDILEHEPTIYDCFKTIEINNKRVTDYLKEFYNTKTSFNDFLKKSYEFLKLHEKEIADI